MILIRAINVLNSQQALKPVRKEQQINVILRTFALSIHVMPNLPKRYTVTAALPYTNGPIHIGHLAGVYVPSDIYARYLRIQKRDVAFICGSDEHGVAISMKARKENTTPQQVIDKYLQQDPP